MPRATFLQALPPSFVDRRGERRLLVWGPLGQWLVVDAELAALLDLFVERRAVEEVIAQYARQSQMTPDAAAAIVRPVIEALVERGILSDAPAGAAPRPERLGVENLTFNITNACNLRCPWCYNRGQDGEPIRPAELIAWLRQGAAALADEAAFIILGGEPFSDETRLLEAVTGAAGLFGGEVLVSTNGTRLGQATPAALARAGVTVQISLDGPTVASHDAIRGQGVFDQALETTRRLVAAGVHTVISTVMTRGSEQHFEAYFDLATRLGVNELRFIPLRRIGRGVGQTNLVPDLDACFRRLVELLDSHPEWARLLARDFFSILMVACRFSRLRDNCGIGRQSLFIDADGSIYPCPNYRGADNCCGNVRDTPLAGLMQTSSVLRCFRDQCRLERIPVCRSCAFSQWCAGDCRAESLSVAGRADASSPYCQDLRKIIPEMFWLLADGWGGIGRRPRPLQPWS